MKRNENYKKGFRKGMLVGAVLLFLVMQVIAGIKFDMKVVKPALELQAYRTNSALDNDGVYTAQQRETANDSYNEFRSKTKELQSSEDVEVANYFKHNGLVRVLIFAAKNWVLTSIIVIFIVKSMIDDKKEEKANKRKATKRVAA